MRRLLTLLCMLLFGVAAMRGAWADAPTVTLTYPAANAIIDQAATPAIVLQASVTDPDEAIYSVTFSVCGPTRCWTPGASVAVAPFQVRWALPQPDGSPSMATTISYRVQVFAQNTLAQTGQSQIVTVTVLQPPMPSSVTLVAPNGINRETGFVTPASPVLYATAFNDTVPPSTLDHVDFLDGDTVLGTVTTPNAIPSGYQFTAPSGYAFVWRNAPMGMHLIAARATNTLGYSSTSDPVTVYIIGPDPPPQVTLSAPTTGQIFAPSSAVPLAASATSALGTIQRVEFMTADRVIATALSPPYVGSWPNPPPGNFAIVARAYDDVGVAATSAAAYVQVLAAPRAPSVVLTAPAPGATVAFGTPLPMAATALAPDGSIGRVDFYTGPTLLGSAATVPYQFSWTNPSAGAQSLTARAYDLQGNVATSAPVAVSVVSHPAPTVSLTAPSNNSTYVAPATIALSATASATGASIAKVEFFANSTLVATRTVSPFNATWSNVAAGAYALTAKATDSLGAATTSAAVNITVTANSPPTVALTLPHTGDSFATGAPIALAATATDFDGSIARVEFYADAALLATSTTAPYGATWSSATPGTHTVLAKAVDDRGAFATSASITIQVATPTLTITTPAAGATIPADFVLVSGTYQAAPNSGVTVNGVVANTDGQGHYFVNNLSLTDGANTLTVTLTTADGQITTLTQTLTRTAVASMQIYVDADADFAPATFILRVRNRTTNTITNITYQNLGGGQLDTSTVDQTTLGKITYASPGVYTPGFTITDSASNTYTQSVALLVQDHNALDQLLKAVWGDFANSLAAGDKNRAMAIMSVPARQKYGPVLDALSPHLAQIIPQWSPPTTGLLGIEVGEFTISRTVDGVKRAFFVYFVLDANGIWRLVSM